MVVLALLIGLVARRRRRPPRRAPGARRARRRIDGSIALERELAAAQAELAVERSTFDERLDAAIAAISTQALDANSARSSSSPSRASRGTCGRSRSRSSGWTSSSRASSAFGRRHTARSPRAYASCARTRSASAPRPGNLVERAARAARARALGRDPAPPRDRDGGDGRALRLRRAADDDGRRRTLLRPDVDREAPGGKYVVIDSKVPLVAYLDAFREDATRTSASRSLADHARQVREHVQRSARRRTGASCRRRRSSSSCSCPTSRSSARPSSRIRRSVELAVSQQRHPRLADEPHRAAPRRRTTAGSRRRSRRARARSATSAASSTSGWRRWARTSRGSASRSTARSRRYNETVGSLERQVLVAGAAVRAARDHRDRAAGAPADRAPDEGARGRGARRPRASRVVRGARRAAPTPREPRNTGNTASDRLLPYAPDGDAVVHRPRANVRVRSKS